jgi:hypothetical protein
MKRTNVNLKPVADGYTATNERIIEFFDEPTQQGGLISFRRTDDGSLVVNVYRVDEKVTVLGCRS